MNPEPLASPDGDETLIATTAGPSRLAISAGVPWPCTAETRTISGKSAFMTVLQSSKIPQRPTHYLTHYLTHWTMVASGNGWTRQHRNPSESDANTSGGHRGMGAVRSLNLRVDGSHFDSKGISTSP